MSSLSARSRVIAVSLRHYYPEPWNGQGHDFSETRDAHDVTVLIEQLGFGPVSVVGHSRGGRVALLAARARPNQVRKLVLMEAALTELLLAAHGTQAHDPCHARFKATARRFEQGDVEGGLEDFVDDVNGPGTWKQRPEEQRQLARDNAWTVVGQAGDTAVITCADLGHLQGPVLLMAGERTMRQSLDTLEAAHQCLPSAQRAMIPEAAHGMHRQNPRAFEAALVKFRRMAPAGRPWASTAMARDPGGPSPRERRCSGKARALWTMEHCVEIASHDV